MSGYQYSESDNLVSYGGGGGGGLIHLSGTNIIGSGNIRANGGDSDKFGYSGEGGGGIIKISNYGRLDGQVE